MRRSLAAPTTFFDLPPENDPRIGLAVDRDGNLFVSDPRGACILSPDAKPLGTLHLPERATSFTFGDADQRTLYLTAPTSLYRVRLLK